MFKKVTAAMAATSLGVIFAAAPAFATATTSTSTVNVAVTAATQATIGVTYSSGSNITCAVGTAVTGIVACTNTATIAGSIRSTLANSGGSQISVTGAAITGSAGSSIAPSALKMTCTGGIVGSPMYAGSTPTLANVLALSTGTSNCGSWTSTVVAPYSLVLSLGIDASQVPSDTYATTGFTATVSTT